MIDIYDERKRRVIMASIRSKRTGPEERVAELLRQLGVRYRRNVKGLAGTPDFVVGKQRVVIFVHGCFWHGHEGCPRATIPATNTEFWQVKITGNKRRDRRIARELRREGWHVITVWECKLKKMKSVQKRLARFVSHERERQF